MSAEQLAFQSWKIAPYSQENTCSEACFLVKLHVSKALHLAYALTQVPNAPFQWKHQHNV